MRALILCLVLLLSVPVSAHETGIAPGVVGVMGACAYQRHFYWAIVEYEADRSTARILAEQTLGHIVRKFEKAGAPMPVTGFCEALKMGYTEVMTPAICHDSKE